MSSEWKVTSIDNIKADSKGSIAIGPFGSRMKSDCYVPSGIPVIRGTNITKGPSFEGEFVYITEEMADTLGSCNVYQDDLVFPHRGAIGEVGILLQEQRCVLSSSLMKLTCNPKKAFSKYLYYFFKSHLGKHELLKNASQVGTPGIGQPLTSLRGIELSLPPLSEQKAIAHILGSLDDKIELNRRINETLEAMAQALFKSWFVDFDPVIDNALVEGNPIPNELAQRAKLRRQALDNGTANRQTATNFPASFQHTEEMGWIPDGWEIGDIGSIAKAMGGYAFKSKSFQETGYPVIKIKNIVGDGTVSIKDAQCIDNQNAGLARQYSLGDGDLVMAMTGATVGKIGIIINGDKKAFLNQRVAKLTGKTIESLTSFLFCFFKHQANFERIVGTAEGSAQPNISSSGIESVPSILPNNELLIDFKHHIDPYFEKWISNYKLSTTLTRLRDTLLPKLISGELRVSDAEKIAREVLDQT